MQTIRLSELKSQQRPVPLQIRVLKKWKLSGMKEEIRYLFVDKHGEGIEATVDIDPKDYYEPPIEVHLAYKLTKYVVVNSNNYCPMLKHQASLKIGKKAYFEPFSDEEIPYHFFQFASYEELDERMTRPKQLTDFIGVVQKIFNRKIDTGKTLRKANIKDASNKLVQLTLWPSKLHLIGDDVKPGDIIAISSAQVTKFGDLRQLESTYPTEVYINPTFPNIQHHIQRLKSVTLDKIESIAQDFITIQDLLNQRTTHEKKAFACVARIKEIQTNRPWFYVHCSNCNKQLYKVIGETTYYECIHHENIQPIIGFCVNAIIIDETAMTNVVLFNEVMTEMLGATAKDMVILHGYDDPTKPPPQLLSKVGIPMTFDLIVKTDGAVIVNKATEGHANSTSSSLTPLSTPSEKVNITPPTPKPKPFSTKKGTNNQQDVSVKRQKN